MDNFVENIILGKEFHQTILAPVCDKYHMTHTEVVILLFLASNPKLNTATDIVKTRRMTKSLVSMSLKNLQERGLLSGEFVDGNHRTIHLNICSLATPIIEDAKKAQDIYFAVLSEGFSNDDIERFKGYLNKISENIKGYHHRVNNH